MEEPSRNKNRMQEFDATDKMCKMGADTAEITELVEIAETAETAEIVDTAEIAGTVETGKLLRVAVYARVSADSGQLQHSIQAQADYYTQLIYNHNNHGTSNWINAGIYIDKGVSGMDMRKRTEFNRMLADCDAGKIDRILVKSVSRFARNTLDLLNTVRHLRACGISVWFEEQRIDSLTQEGELLLTLAASIAQAESESISENAKWAIRKGFGEGKENTRHRTFGYRWVGGVQTVVPEEACVVQHIYAEFLRGVPVTQIAKKLAAKGIRTITGKPISTSAVSFILRNITYTGNTLLQKTFVSDPISKKKIINKGELPQYLVEGDHEAIISNPVFEQVQRQLAKNHAERKFPYNHTGQTYPFTGKIICGTCGRHYTRQLWNSGKGGVRRATWVCTGKKNGGKRVCASKNISEETLMQICAKQLGMEQFDEMAFKEKVKSIIVNVDNINIENADGVTTDGFPTGFNGLKRVFLTNT